MFMGRRTHRSRSRFPPIPARSRSGQPDRSEYSANRLREGSMRFLFLVWTVSAAYGQVWPGLPQRIRFEGVVVDFISGNPIPDVAVSARNCQKILTDAGGRFALECPYAYDVEHSL